MFGPRGEIEITRHSGDEISDAVRVSLQIAKSANLGTVIAFSLTAAIWIRAAGFWDYWDALTDWIYIVWLVVLGIPWIVSPIALIAWYLVPKLRNVNWPPPFAQVDIANPRAPVTWADSRAMDMNDDRPASIPVAVREAVWRVEGALESSDGLRSVHERVELANAPAWHKFCQAVVGGKNFSHTEAVRRNGVDVGDWDKMYRQFLDRGWATDAGKRGTPILSPTGNAWIRHYARTPPPTLPPEAASAAATDAR